MERNKIARRNEKFIWNDFSHRHELKFSSSQDERKKKSNVERKINSNVDPFLSFTAEAAFLRDFSDVLHLERKRAGPG